ncbi:MAG: hypothetical protein ACRDE5_13890 [Ginsengibacter sp.]
MPTVIIRHKVGNIDTWLNGHQDRVELFSQAGASMQEFQDTEDPNSVALILEVTDMDKLNEMMQDPIVQEKKEAHTVIDPLVIYMPVGVEV